MESPSLLFPLLHSSPHLKRRNAWLGDPAEVRLHYIDCPPPPGKTSKGTILLIHGFPQTSHQFRHVITPLADAGYRIIAPDYRGCGQSSCPPSSPTAFTKNTMANDLIDLIHKQLGITSPVHLVGHDIGGMIAHAYASRHPTLVSSIVWGECPLPGTTAYANSKTMPTVQSQFHFIFHSVPDLPEALVTGREKLYLQHFYDKLAFNTGAITRTDLEHYALMYSQPGRLRCAFAVYAAFERDAAENRAWLSDHGKCKVPALAFSGSHSHHAAEAEEMAREMYENVEVAEVDESGHYLAEENPEDFVKKVLAFVGKHGGRSGSDL